MAAERREHRLALEILYAVEIGNVAVDEALRQARDQVGVFDRGDRAKNEDPYEPEYPAVDARAGAPQPTDWALVEHIVRGTLAHRDEVLAEVEPLLERWKISRLAGIDRLLLEMGGWELRHRPEARTTEIINHAVELARRLSTERSAGFVNAILDALAKTQPRPSGMAQP
jgi:transcription antitermination factor NusB